MGSDPAVSPPGGLSLAVEGPSKAEISCTDNQDGTCSVSYLPVLPGDYSIAVKYNEKHIAGSPFTARITGTGGGTQGGLGCHWGLGEPPRGVLRRWLGGCGRVQEGAGDLAGGHPEGVLGVLGWGSPRGAFGGCSSLGSLCVSPSALTRRVPPQVTPACGCPT